ncbi:hypothetical protein R4P47_24095 [Rhodococcus sp. IEGM 1370]|uniref:hypothetical protein n=1 Tax=unclassified Rhodococcus (in: high G+C Gram-positive bacteria) TaxID=192944 RepID=UPI0011EBCE7D|nr:MULTISPECIES: hypothetical protein [unclassified Rhodococcus (in: high G+C Gram-positive bacteria)]KAA0922662.1 hypothetical protein FQ188_20990 [Rhodococcus sp. ANT_H53B]MDV8079656.1 hypothetical protein [Rhodococcus sp. IEGM 1370]
MDGNDEQVREYEQKWLTESIPALEGWTPRDAAADPTFRDERTSTARHAGSVKNASMLLA